MHVCLLKLANKLPKNWSWKRALFLLKRVLELMIEINNCSDVSFLLLSALYLVEVCFSMLWSCMAMRVLAECLYVFLTPSCSCSSDFIFFKFIYFLMSLPKCQLI